MAVTCHYDVTEWLAARLGDRHGDVAFQRRCLRRPPIELEIFRCRRSAWRLFARHHYLSGALSSYARCFLALWEGVPVAFCATAVADRRGRTAGASAASSRCPTIKASASAWPWPRRWPSCTAQEGYRLNVTASHPAVIAHCRRSPRWRAVGVKKTGSRKPMRFVKNYRGSAGRAVVSFEYISVRHCFARSGVGRLAMNALLASRAPAEGWLWHTIPVIHGAALWRNPEDRRFWMR